MQRPERNPRILLVDDEVDLLQNLADLLQRRGFDVLVAIDGEEALRQAEFNNPDLIVLDVIMPKLNGLDVLRRLRQRDKYIPVIMLSKVGGPSERGMALLLEQADDYLNKPFDSGELVGRITSVLRRPSAQGEEALQRGDEPPRYLVSSELRLDTWSQRAWLGERDLNVPAIAIRLLAYLMAHPDRAFSRAQLLDAVWGRDAATSERTVDTRVSELRTALDDNRERPTYIRTVRSTGYSFVGQVESRW